MDTEYTYREGKNWGRDRVPKREEEDKSDAIERKNKQIVGIIKEEKL